MINCSPSKASERISLAFDTLALPSVQNKEMYPYAFDLLVLALPHLPAKWSAHLQQATPASQYMFLHKHQSWLLRHICLVRVCHLFFGLECLPCCNLICSASKVWLYTAKKKRLLFGVALGERGRVSKAPSIDRNVCVAVSSWKQSSMKSRHPIPTLGMLPLLENSLFLRKDDITGSVGLEYVFRSTKDLLVKYLS